MADDRLPSLLEEIDYLQACAETAATAPDAFDLEVLMPRFGNALAAVTAALKLADAWDEMTMTTPHEQTCAAQLRRVITRALTGEADDAAT